MNKKSDRQRNIGSHKNLGGFSFSVFLLLIRSVGRLVSAVRKMMSIFFLDPERSRLPSISLFYFTRMLVVAGLIFIVFGGVGLFGRYIFALNSGNEQSLELYSGNCYSRTDPSKADWMNSERAGRIPQLTESAEASEFGSRNSTLYRGGAGAMFCDDFAVENAEMKKKNKEEEKKPLSSYGDFESARIMMSLAINKLPELEPELVEEDISELGDQENIKTEELGLVDEGISELGDQDNIKTEEQGNIGTEEQGNIGTPLGATSSEIEEQGNIKTEEQDNIGTEEQEVQSPEKPVDGASEDSGIISLLRKFISVRSAVAVEGDPKFILWYSFSNERVSSSSDFLDMDTGEVSANIWRQVEEITSEETSNMLRDGYLSIPADFIKNWDNLDGLMLKLEGVLPDGSRYEIMLDSVWVEASYIPNQSRKKMLEREDAFEFFADESLADPLAEPEMKFKYDKEDKSWLDMMDGIFNTSDYWRDVEVSAKVEDALGNEIEMPVELDMNNGGEFSVLMPQAGRVMKPGRHTVEFVIVDRSGDQEYQIELSQDFDWGVLTINTNKNYYIQNESAYLQFGVIDDEGHTLCNAELSLTITSPSGEVMEMNNRGGEIVNNPECGPDNVIDTPDYYAYLSLPERGEYSLVLQAETENGLREITETIKVVSSVDFDIERVGPTRIFPPADYDMEIRVTPSEDWQGDIEEMMLMSFGVKEWNISIMSSERDPRAENFRYESSDNIELSEKTLAWRGLSVNAGETLVIRYRFDAPNISPEYYQLGPLRVYEIVGEGELKLNFAEWRKWQIASDAVQVGTYIYTVGSGATWTSPGNAFNNTAGYASKVIPKNSANDSANYIEGTTNNVPSLSWPISKVEICVEGYVSNIQVSAWIYPYFLSGLSGTSYQVLGSELTTSDTDALFCSNITNVTNAPSPWTWAQAQGVDGRVYGLNGRNQDETLYIDQVYVRVTYDDNIAATSTILSAVQKSGSSGTVDISASFSDINGDALKAKLHYETGTSCAFISETKLVLDETDATATSTYQDAKILNSNPYQIGNASGWITTASGTNIVNFDWLSASSTNLADEEGTYCLRLVANDNYVDQSPVATTTIDIDNKAPTVPGVLSMSSHTKNSVTLAFGASSSDFKFSEYKIYWKSYTGTDVTESDTPITSSTVSALGYMNFNNATSTKLSGLGEGLQYSFVIFTYDQYGHKASSTRVDFYTNTPPDTVVNSILSRTDSSGKVDISADFSDANYEDSQVKILYEAGSSCAFVSTSSATLGVLSFADYGYPNINNANPYQLGNSDGWILTSASNTLVFEWLSKTDLPTGDNTYCLKFIASDQNDDDSTPATSTVVIDNQAPTVPGNLSNYSVTATSVTLTLGATSTESHFVEYKIYYKVGTSGVTEANTLFSSSTDPHLGNINFSYATTTTIGGLDPETDYVFNIWVYDSYSQQSNAVTEVTAKTNASIANEALNFTNPSSGNIVIANGSSEWNFRASILELNGYEYLDTVVLRLADYTDSSPPYNDLRFQWTQATNSFSEIGADALSAVSLSSNSTSTCAGVNCTLDFKLIFNINFATSSTNYSAQLFSTNDTATTDEDSYADIYQVQMLRMVQTRWRWRVDDGGE